MGIRNLAAKAAVVQDSEPQGPQDNDAVETDAATEVTASVVANDDEAPKTKASVLRRGPAASPSSVKSDIMDESVDSSFSGAVADDSIEKGIADAVDSNRPSLDDDAPAPGADAGGGEGGDRVAADKKDDPENDPEDEIENVQTGPGPFLNLSGISGLGKSHEVLVELLSSAMNRDDAVKTALEYNTYLQTEVLPAIESLNLSAREKEEMRKRAESEAARQTTGGGGIMGSLFSALGRPFKAITPGDEEKIGRERRRILSEASGHAERMAMRMSGKIKDNYVMTLKEADNANNALVRAVNSYNAAVFDAPECADIKKAFVDRAAQLDISPDEVLRAVTSGKDHADLAEMVASLPEGVSSRPEVKAAAEAMTAAREELDEAFAKATRQAETLQKNIFDNDRDIESMRAQLLKAIDVAQESNPRPVDREKAEELKKRMQEFREAVEARFLEIMKRLEQFLGMKPQQP